MTQLERKRPLFAALLGLSFWVVTGQDPCPFGCICPKVRSQGFGEGVKVKCSSADSKISSLGRIDFQRAPPNVVHLDLSGNAITTIPRGSFIDFTLLEKLDLKNNKISIIEDEAFTNLTHLKRLDLSGNRIGILNATTFEGLESLERLKINQNILSRLKEASLVPLVSLKQLDLSMNPIICDCQLSWILDWIQNSSVKLSPTSQCQHPPALKGKPIRKLESGDLHCNWPPQLPTFELQPAVSQVVFAGDSLRLFCRVSSIEQNVRITWLWHGAEVSTDNQNRISVDRQYNPEKGLLESSVNIGHLLEDHAGVWNCLVYTDRGNESKSVSIIVISEKTKYCAQTVTSTNKGTYVWPKTIVGTTVELSCEAPAPSITDSQQFVAYQRCGETGSWMALNTTNCLYISETTRALEQFAKIDPSVLKTTVLENAKRLRNYTANLSRVKDKMDVVFISQTIENYLEYLTKEKELGSVVMDIVSTGMGLPSNLLVSAQLEDTSCSRLVNSVETVAQHIPSSHKINMAVEEFRFKKESFTGITCTWYSQVDVDSGRLFHCFTSNRSTLAGSQDRMIEASIQVPGSLFYQLEMQGISVSATSQLLVSVYKNNKFFPRIFLDPLEQDRRDVTSCVIGSKLVDIDVQNLTEPVFVMLRTSVGTGMTSSPVWWDPEMHGGIGGWNQDGCKLLHMLPDLLVFHCDRLGYFGLLQDVTHLQEYRGRIGGAEFRFSHPAVYVGSIVGVFCLLVTVITYIICHASIQMSRKAKHSLVNTWTAIALLYFMFSLGIYQTENPKICQGVGLMLHYLSLCSLLWMAITTSNLYKKLTKPDVLEATPDDEPLPDQPIPQQPMLGFYLVGWGIALIVCGISGAVNMTEYGGYSYCFLTFGPSISAVYIPIGMVLSFLLIFFLLIKCVLHNIEENGQFSEGTQVTENVDLELLETNPSNAERASIRSVQSLSSDEEDQEHPPASQLKAHIVTLVLFLLTWISAAMATSCPLRDYVPYEEAIFGVLYCLFSIALGIFVLLFFCISRNDVRVAWSKFKCEKRGRCCRSRSISDTHPLPVMNLAHPNIQIMASSNSINSAHTNKSNSTTQKSGPTSKTDSGGKISNINLVFMQSNSITEGSVSGADIFYNPHQSGVARKFFRKQRQLKQNSLPCRNAHVDSDNVSLPSNVQMNIFSPPDVEGLTNAAQNHVGSQNMQEAKKSRSKHHGLEELRFSKGSGTGGRMVIGAERKYCTLPYRHKTNVELPVRRGSVPSVISENIDSNTCSDKNDHSSIVCEIGTQIPSDISEHRDTFPDTVSCVTSENCDYSEWDYQCAVIEPITKRMCENVPEICCRTLDCEISEPSEVEVPLPMPRPLQLDGGDKKKVPWLNVPVLDSETEKSDILYDPPPCKKTEDKHKSASLRNKHSFRSPQNRKHHRREHKDRLHYSSKHNGDHFQQKSKDDFAADVDSLPNGNEDNCEIGRFSIDRETSSKEKHGKASKKETSV